MSTINTDVTYQTKLLVIVCLLAIMLLPLAYSESKDEQGKSNPPLQEEKSHEETESESLPDLDTGARVPSCFLFFGHRVVLVTEPACDQYVEEV